MSAQIKAQDAVALQVRQQIVPNGHMRAQSMQQHNGRGLRGAAYVDIQAQFGQQNQRHVL
jgi:hypothetical protein